MDVLTFDEKTHTYTLNGEPIPNVTTILSTVNPIPDHIRNRLDFEVACDFGSEVHKATEERDKGNEFNDFTFTNAEPFADSWELFVEENVDDFVAIEQKVFSTKHYYCGTVDRIIKAGNRNVLIDIKTGGKSSSHKTQIAAYVVAAREMGFTIDNGMIVYVDKEGYSVTDVPLAQSILDWFKVLNTYRLIQAGKEF